MTPQKTFWKKEGGLWVWAWVEEATGYSFEEPWVTSPEECSGHIWKLEGENSMKPLKWEYRNKEFDSVKDVVSAALGEYLTGDFGQRLAFHADGVVCLMGQNSFNRDEIASKKCHGVGNMDMSFYREGWPSDGLSDRECILNCVENGDNSAEIESITSEIEQKLEQWEKEQEKIA